VEGHREQVQPPDEVGNFHDEEGSYFGTLGLEDNSKSDNKVLFYAAGSMEPVLYEGVLKQRELSEFIVSVIKGGAGLVAPKKSGVLDAQSELSHDSEIPESTPVVHEEL